MQVNGLNDSFGIQTLNSRDTPDRFGRDPYVARVVVGGTRAEAGLPLNVAGRAEHIDIGNFRTADEAIVTLDVVQEGLTFFPPPPDKLIDNIAYGITALIVHEAGHLFGCLHTSSEVDPFEGQPGVMALDLIAALIGGLGPDVTFGTGDDIDLRYTAFDYSPDDVFSGFDDTLNTVAFGLSTGKALTLGGATVARAAADPPAARAVGGPLAEVDATLRGPTSARVGDPGSATLRLAWGAALWLGPSAARLGWPSDPVPANSPEPSASGDRGDRGRRDLPNVQTKRVAGQFGRDGSDGKALDALHSGEWWRFGGVYVGDREGSLKVPPALDAVSLKLRERTA